jgi:hypothetical protein
MLSSINLFRFGIFIVFFSFSFYFHPLYSVLSYFGFINILPNDYNINYILKNVNIVKPIIIGELLHDIKIYNINTYLKFISCECYTSGVEGSIKTLKGLYYNISHILYNNITGKNVLFVKSHFQDYSLPKISNTIISITIFNESFLRLTDLNKLILSSSKANYMALDICTRAYYSLKNNTSILDIKYNINCINIDKKYSIYLLPYKSVNILVYSKSAFKLENLLWCECSGRAIDDKFEPVIKKYN